MKKENVNATNKQKGIYYDYSKTNKTSSTNLCRRFVLRGGAIIQTFPLDYQFVKPNEPVRQETIGRLIGNAVPVKLGEVIGRSIVVHVNDIHNTVD